MDNKSIEKLELNKILAQTAELCSLEGGKAIIKGCLPSVDMSEVRRRLSLTFECDRLLYVHGTGKIEQFCNMSEDGQALRLLVLGKHGHMAKRLA